MSRHWRAPQRQPDDPGAPPAPAGVDREAVVIYVIIVAAAGFLAGWTAHLLASL